MLVKRGLTFFATIFLCMDEGVVFIGLSCDGGIGESIMIVSEFLELYGVPGSALKVKIRNTCECVLMAYPLQYLALK